MAEPTGRQRLEWLAAAFGVEPGFEDIWGRRHEVPDAGLRALLDQLGVPADSDADIDRGLARAHVRYWRSLAEPVVVLTLPAATLAVTLRLPSRGSGARVAWRLVPETGEPSQGDAEVDAMALRERSEVEGVAHESRTLAIDAALAPGYHRLELRTDDTEASVLVIAAPPHCFQPSSLAQGTRMWGWAVQLYGLRSARNWGVGDFGDLLALVDVAAARGASAIGLNPLHARFPHNPAHASPYAPSSRLWLDVLAIDVESVDDFAQADAVRAKVQSDAFRARLQRLRNAELVDYEGVSSAKHEALRDLYTHFRQAHLERDTPRATAFRAFQSAGGAALRRHALFEALQERFHAADPSIWGWPVWPEPWRDPSGDPVAQFEAGAIERIEYYEYLQWQAARQLARAAARCRERGMAIGLYLDLAVSVDRAGSDCWSFGSCFAASASVGAPPDDFNLSGQDWGLPPLIPEALRACGHEPFILALRANMRHAGALRIDHVMGLMRLYWIAPGASARQGGYVRYPLHELLAIVALESHRNRCLVVGEDLGTVPDAVRAALVDARVLSYRLLYFERDRSGAFKPSAAYPHDALVCVGTHDLPTLAGWWTGRDLQLRRELGLFPDDAAHAAQVRERASDRARLLAALASDGRLSPDADLAALAQGPLTAGLVEAAHLFLARSPARLMMVQPEDWLGVTEQNNLPGTTDQHPNWRRKLPLTVDELASDPAGGRLAVALVAERESPRAVHAADEPAQARIPRSTYRLQLNRDFGLPDALRVLPYLDRLGVGDLYCSPVLRARPGSRHGYDIIDHRSINPEIGGEAAFDALSAALRKRGMGVLFDMVPNHMGVLGGDNEWWMDLLEHGPSSPYAHFFDIDWHPVNSDLDGKVLVPLLGDHYGLALERGELALRFEPVTGGFVVGYHEHRLPIDPREATALLERAQAQLAAAARPELRDEFAALARAFANLPPREAAGEERAIERARDTGVYKRQLARLAAGHPAIRAAIDAAVEALNGRSATARNALHELLERQAWRLAYWRVASDEINYRRFFDINELAALRIEDESVFEATHGLVLDLAASGRIDGLRIDHPDGLFDPGEYFERLQLGYARRIGAAMHTTDRRPPRPLYVVAEKIAAAHERVPERWAIHGTTGYRFGAVTNGLFVDATAKGRIDRTWRAFSGERASFEEVAYTGKQLIMRDALASELSVLAAELLRIARSDRRTRDYTYSTLRRALAEVAAGMPVYRTYLTDRASKQDRRYIHWAVGRAIRHSRAVDTTIFGFVRDALLGRAPPGSSPTLRTRTRRFARRFQQFTSPVAAKGVEDTALYRFNRLVSLNEVGSDPDAFGISIRAFHAANLDRAARWPHTMLATSTHDNKRSEDVRARIDVISEMPAAWRLLLRRWRLMNRSRRSSVSGEPAPTANDEYLLYQILLGTCRTEEWTRDDAGQSLAAYAGRVERYMLKAARESRTNTSWISPDAAYEGALSGFVRGILAPSASNPFLDDLREQVEAVRWFGALNSLAMVAIKYTAPGVPDLYQGNECFDFSLVDPDNRHPVDFERRAALLDAIERRVRDEGLEPVAASLSRDPRTDEAKLFVTWRLMQMRRTHAALFRDGDYLPLEAAGEKASHLVAYGRRTDSVTVVTVASRLFARLLGTPNRLPEGAEVWSDARIVLGEVGVEGELVDQLTGRTIRVAEGALAVEDALSGFPAAVLLGQRRT